MRDFTFEDGFALSAIGDKIDMKIDLNALLDAMKLDKEKAAYMGGQMFLDLFKKMYLAKNELIQLIADMTGDSVENVKKYNLAKLKETVTEMFNQPGLIDFFKSAGASLEKK